MMHSLMSSKIRKQTKSYSKDIYLTAAILTINISVESRLANAVVTLRYDQRCPLVNQAILQDVEAGNGVILNCCHFQLWDSKRNELA